VAAGLRIANPAAAEPSPATSQIGFTGHVQDAESELVSMQRRHDHPIAGRFLSVDPVVMDANTGKSLWRYHYGENSPSRYRDPDGRAVETPWDAANVAWGVASFAKNIATGNYAGAAVDAVGVAIDVVATAVPGVPGGASAAIQAGRVADKVADAAKGAPSFDKAREVAFQKAGMTDPSKVQFSKVDPKTGTVVEFKGEGGAKVGYDGPHKSPGPHHDTQHISWQSAGKRDSGGAQRGNEPYSGPRHPSRPDRKDQ
jgi:RHS repeat-associated protein